VVNLIQDFEFLFARNIIHIAFGEDISANEVELLDLKGPDPRVLKRFKFAEAVGLVGSSVFQTAKFKQVNPLWSFIYHRTGISVPFTAFERQVNENCRRMREFTRQYVQSRR